MSDDQAAASAPGLVAGVHMRRGEVADLIAQFDAAGWRVGCMSGGSDLRGVLRRLGEAAEFPRWYGVNLDAAWDCLTDLTEPVAIVWHDWERFAVSQADDFARVVALWRDRAEQAPDFAVVLVT